MPANAPSEKAAQPTKATISEVSALAGCATVSTQMGHFYFAQTVTFQLGCNTLLTYFVKTFQSYRGDLFKMISVSQMLVFFERSF